MMCGNARPRDLAGFFLICCPSMSGDRQQAGKPLSRIVARGGPPARRVRIVGGGARFAPPRPVRP